MRFEFDNLGPIKHGEVELGNLTVFCGKNNTGKTYVNYLIYGFFDYLKGMLDFIEEFKNALKIKDKYFEFDLYIFKKELSDAKKEILNKFIKEIPRIFNHSGEMFSTFCLNIMGDNSLEDVSIEFLRDITYKKVVGTNVKVEELSQNVLRITLLRHVEDNWVKYLAHATTIVVLLEVLFNYSYKSIFMLPAERSGLNMFYRELNVNRNNIIYNMTNQRETAEFETRVSRYPLAISKYINLLNTMDERKDKKSEYNDYAVTLEKKIIYGKFSISENGIIQFMTGDEEKLDFHLSSSTAKSLFGLDYLLNNELEEGSILIIDEPEQNLHPDNQRYIARLLVKLANAGIKVVISTHSDYIIKELNNLILLSNKFQGYEEVMKKYHYEEDELLKKEDIRGYIFMESTIKDVTVDEEGMQMTIFDDAINEMNEASDDIYYTYCEGAENEQ